MVFYSVLWTETGGSDATIRLVVRVSAKDSRNSDADLRHPYGGRRLPTANMEDGRGAALWIALVADRASAGDLRSPDSVQHWEKGVGTHTARHDRLYLVCGAARAVLPLWMKHGGPLARPCSLTNHRWARAGKHIHSIECFFYCTKLTRTAI